MLSGAAFDSAYVASQINSHERALGILGGLREHARNPTLRELIRDAVSEMQMHRERARRLSADQA